VSTAAFPSGRIENTAFSVIACDAADTYFIVPLPSNDRLYSFYYSDFRLHVIVAYSNTK
jgi:hypothetical protein